MSKTEEDMRKAIGSIVVTAAVAVLAATPATAGDVCKKPLSAEGAVVTGWTNGMAAARAAWERQAAKVHGRQFADWWYSGDRSIECTWDDRGVKYRCRAVAIPCARRR